MGLGFWLSLCFLDFQIGWDWRWAWRLAEARPYTKPPFTFDWLLCRSPQTWPCFEDNLGLDTQIFSFHLFVSVLKLPCSMRVRALSPSKFIGDFHRPELWDGIVPFFTPCLWLLSTLGRQFICDLLHILLPF
jgi:hypothetical protein